MRFKVPRSGYQAKLEKGLGCPGALAVKRKKDCQAQIGQRIFQARGGIVNKGLGETQDQYDQNGGKIIAAVFDSHQYNCCQGKKQADEHSAVIDFSGQPAAKCNHEQPQRMREGLYPLVRIPGQPQAVDKIIHRPEGYIGIVADPGMVEQN